MKFMKYLIITSIFFHLTNFANALNGTFYLKDLQGDYIEYKNTFVKAKFEIFTDQQNVIRIKPDNEHFLSANRDDLSVVARTNSEGWESFAISEILPNQYAFKTHHNTYLAKSAGYSNYSQFNITQANSPFPFILENVNNCNDEHLYYLQAENGTFLQNTIELNNSTTFSFDNNNRTKVCVEERNGNQFVSLKVSNKYLSANRYDPNLVPRDEPLEWETFEVRNENNGFISLKTYHGSTVQIIANQNGNFILNHTHSLQNNSHLFSFVKAFNDEKIANNVCYYLKNSNSNYLASNFNTNSFYLSNEKNTSSIYCIDINENGLITFKNIIDNKFISIHGNNIYRDEIKNHAAVFLPIQQHNKSYSFMTDNNRILVINNSFQLKQEDNYNREVDGIYLERINSLEIETLNNNLNLSQRKRDFLNNKNLSHPFGIKSRLINFPQNELNSGRTCPSTRIATYDSPNSGGEVYCLKISDEFKYNLPNRIKRELIKYNINNLDLFFIAQNKNETYSEPKVSLIRTHNWVYKNIPNVFEGTIYNNDLLMTYYNNNENLFNLNNDEVEEGTLKSFNVNIHDDRISPNNAHTSLGNAPNLNFSFYSLVIDPVESRAIVTLHWLVEQNDFLNNFERNPNNFQNSLQYLNNGINNNISIHDLINLFDNSAVFNNTEPLNSLKQLLITN